MRIEAVQTVAAPQADVFAGMTDFASFEARARRRGIPVERRSDEPPAWRIGVEWRDLALNVEVAVVSLRAPSLCVAAVSARGVEGRATVDVAPGPEGAVVAVAMDLGARGMAGRMLMQTLRLARPMLESRLRGVLARLAGEIEAAASGGADPRDRPPEAPRSW